MTCSSQGSQTEEAIQTTKEITPPHTLPAISHPFSISVSQVLLLRSLPVMAPPSPISNAPNYPLTASEGLKDVTDEELPLLPSCLINVIWHLYRSAVHYRHMHVYRPALLKGIVLNKTIWKLWQLWDLWCLLQDHDLKKRRRLKRSLLNCRVS